MDKPRDEHMPGDRRTCGQASKGTNACWHRCQETAGQTLTDGPQGSREPERQTGRPPEEQSDIAGRQTDLEWTDGRADKTAGAGGVVGTVP